MKKEVWKPVPGFPGYEVSDRGRVRSLDRYVKKRSGGIQFYPGKIIKPIIHNNGKFPHGDGAYQEVQLSNCGKKQHKYVHRLVLEVFVGPSPPGMECRHYPDRERSNNNLKNLSWGTREENSRDRETHGTVTRGEKNGFSVLTEDQVVKIIAIRSNKSMSQKQVAKMFGVTASNIAAIEHGISWRHIIRPNGVADALNRTPAAPDRKGG